jgi:subtilisin family serine protease
VLFVGAAADESGAGSVLHQPGVIEVASSESRSSLASAVYAPGHEILTLLPEGHYDFASGASIATAQVSGVVALMLARNPGLSAAAALRVLRETSAGAAEDGSLKQVDACAAVVTLAHQGVCSSTSSDDRAVAADQQARPRLASH